MAICTTAAITGIALQTSIQTHYFIQNWTKYAHTMWATQAQIDEDIQDEIQELKSHQMGWRSTNRCTNTGDAKM